MKVNCSIADGVARISMDDGKVNAMSADMLREISAALAEAQAQDAIVVLTGRPGIFSAGFDMNTFAAGPEPSSAMLQAGVDAIIDILDYPRPVITCAAGHAFPMGAFLMLAADVRIGVQGDFKIGMNETAIKIDVPDFALALAKSRLSQTAFAAIRTARMFTPDAAVLAGYLDHAVAGPEAPKALAAEIESALGLDPEAFRSTKRRMNAPVVEAVRSAGLPVRLLV